MSPKLKVIIGAAAVVAVVLGGAFVLAPRPPDNVVGGKRTAPSPSPTAGPTPSSSSAPTPIDTTAWTTYTSSQYGSSIGHPSDWTVDRASRAWTWDDAKEFLNPAQEELP